MERGERSAHRSFVCFEYEISKGPFLTEKELLQLSCDVAFPENTRGEKTQNYEKNTSHNFTPQCTITLTIELSTEIKE